MNQIIQNEQFDALVPYITEFIETEPDGLGLMRDRGLATIESLNVPTYHIRINVPEQLKFDIEKMQTYCNDHKMHFFYQNRANEMTIELKNAEVYFYLQMKWLRARHSSMSGGVSAIERFGSPIRRAQ